MTYRNSRSTAADLSGPTEVLPPAALASLLGELRTAAGDPEPRKDEPGDFVALEVAYDDGSVQRRSTRGGIEVVEIVEIIEVARPVEAPPPRRPALRRLGSSAEADGVLIAGGTVVLDGPGTEGATDGVPEPIGLLELAAETTRTEVPPEVPPDAPPDAPPEVPPEPSLRLPAPPEARASVYPPHPHSATAPVRWLIALGLLAAAAVAGAGYALAQRPEIAAGEPAGVDPPRGVRSGDAHAARDHRPR